MYYEEIRSVLKKPSSTLIIFALTILGYGGSYVFQFAYLKYFDISYKFIGLNIPILIISIAITIFCLMGLDNVSGAYKEVMRGLNFSKPIHRLVGVMLSLVSVLIIPFLFLMYGIGASTLLTFQTTAIMFGILLAGEFIPIIIYAIKLKSFTKGIARSYEIKDKNRQEAKDKRTETYGEKYNGVVLIVLISLVTFLAAGRFYAENQNGLYVVEDHGNIKTLLIQRDDERMLLRDYNIKTRSFEPGFKSQKTPDNLLLNERVSIKSKK